MIEAPSNCPSCESLLEWSNDTLYCRNPNCEAKTYKRIEHFAKTLRIKGLGPSTIEKLDINSIEEIYELEIAYVTFCLKSGKLAVKLLEEIEKSKQEPLNTVLPAFGISLVGRTAADKLSQVCNSLFDIDEDTCRSAGLGPKATANLMKWLDEEFPKYMDLPFSFEFAKSSGNKGVICISGKLNSFKTKKEAAAVLEKLGYKVKDSITKDVTILVNESNRETDKTKKARESGIQIVNNLQNFINGE